MKQTIERELKFEVGPGFRLPALPGTPLPVRVFVSTYYDTLDHCLARRGVTLRRRTERRKHRWQLKLPSGAARLELEVPGAPGPPPAELRRLVVVFTRGEELMPVATLRTRRSGVLVRDLGGPVAEAVVDTVAVLQGDQIAQRFREAEVELVRDDEDALEHLGALLETAGAAKSDGRPKLFRALGLDVPDAPKPLSPSASTVDRIVAMMRDQLDAIRAHDPGTRLGTDPEELHKMRTAVRRLRANLRAVRPVLDGDWLDELRGELGWLGGVLGAVRDLDVLGDSLRPEITALERDESVAGHRLLARLEAERARAREDLFAALDDPRYFALLDRLEEIIQRPHEPASDLSLPDIAAAEFKKLRKAVDGLPEEPTDGDLHAVRIKVKRARYAGELAQPIVGRPAERFVERARRLQDILGEHQDAVVAETHLRSLLKGARGRGSGFVAGRLVERQEARRREARRDFLEQWPKLARRGRKAWKGAREG